jgi:hypothetical protein
MIQDHKDLIKMIDARKAIPPSLEPMLVKAYKDVFGQDENLRGYISCKCPSYMKLFYSNLKLKLNEYERNKIG